ncbi:hypothetical protein BAE44_0025539 [Dichanthelium oligosanthes]|uniref:Uncharacterized protein n=1 Tax=Dichanthelium oligosanthes TaxID=888268 RepID=A0A1E5UKN7_9POAL|nr:hypothetical protein BAE44_0025539 [Dichanthelium oligosanthes]
MLHAVYFDKSTVGEWMISYLNKYVNSDTIELERQKSEVEFIPAAGAQPYAILAAFVLYMLRFGKPVKDSANTSIFKVAGRAFAISENHQPYEINVTNLDTIGPYDIDGSWGRPFTSHPKVNNDNLITISEKDALMFD